METLHVHHWDSMMLLEESTRSLFPSDLYIPPGDQPPVTDENLSMPMVELYRGAGIFAHEDPVRAVSRRIEELAPEWIHAMHGATIKGEALHYFTSALREHEFAYNGVLLGREVAPGVDASPATAAAS
jgi:flavorubredoxin